MLSRPGSSPALTRSSPAFNLRQYSLDRRRLRPESAGRTPHPRPEDLEEVDLVGGNGRWRQRRAEVEFEKRHIRDLEEQRQKRVAAEKQRRREELKQEKKKRQLEEHKRERLAQQERLRIEAEEREQTRLQQEEKERQRKEEEHRDFLARQPYTCERCKGGGKCTSCGGQGQFFSLFLVPAVSKTSVNDFGRMPQGCEACGGQTQNLLGKLRLGNGRCSDCRGQGKIWPIVETRRTGRRGLEHSGTFNFGSTAGGDSSAGSPKSLAGLNGTMGAAQLLATVSAQG